MTSINFVQDPLGLERILNTHDFFFIVRDQFIDGDYEEHLNIVEDKLKEFTDEKTVRKRLFYVIVESVQNIFRYGQAGNLDVHSLLILGKNESGYYVQTSNPITIDQVEPLTQHLEFINGLTVDEVKARYREKLANGERTEGGGAGLGLLDMARKAGGTLEYIFQEFEGGYSYFTLRINFVLAT